MGLCLHRAETMYKTDFTLPCCIIQNHYSESFDNCTSHLAPTTFHVVFLQPIFNPPPEAKQNGQLWLCAPPSLHIP